MQSVPITTKVVSLNPAHGEVYSIQLYVIKFVSELWQFSPVSYTKKTDDITELLLKVELNTITLTHNIYTESTLINDSVSLCFGKFKFYKFKKQ